MVDAGELEDSVQEPTGPPSAALENKRRRCECCGPFTEAARLLYRNPQLAKTVLASGLQQASIGVTNTFLLNVLMGRLWGKSQAQFNAILGIAINVLAAATGGPFGRFSDSVDRRIAAVVFGVGQFLPGWAVCVLGLTESGLWLATLSRVIGTIGSSSNVIFALSNDVTSFDDREVAAGIFFAGSNLLVVALNAIPIPFSDSGILVLIYQVVLNVGYFVCLATVKTHPNNERGEGSDSSEAEASPQRARVEGSCLKKTVLNPLKLIFMHRRLRRLCLTGFLLALANTLTMTVSQQYFNSALNLYPYGTPAQFAKVSLLSTLPGQLMVLPGFLLTGFLAKQSGTMKLLRHLIPIGAALIIIGAFMALVKAMWFVPVIVIAGNYASLPNVPLMRLVAGVAPPARMGEALSAAGVSMQLAGLVGNAFVAIANPILLTLPLPNVLWVYYPLCGILTLLALWPVMGSPKGGWGAAAGMAKDAFHADVSAMVAANRWKRKTRESRNSANNSIESGTEESVDSSSEDVSESSTNA